MIKCSSDLKSPLQAQKVSGQFREVIRTHERQRARKGFVYTVLFGDRMRVMLGSSLLKMLLKGVFEGKHCNSAAPRVPLRSTDGSKEPDLGKRW